jgi:hypothetical protein
MVSELAGALAKFQTELPAIPKGETARIEPKDGGRSYEYSYADLADVAAVVLPLLGEHGLAFTAWPTLDEGRFVLAYTLMHESGEERSGSYPLPASGSPQQIGAVITYARRYCLCAVTGVAPGGDDNDAAGAVEVRMDRPAVDPAVEALKAAKTQLADVWRAKHNGQFDIDALRAAYEQHMAAPLDDAGVDELRSFRLHLASQPAETTDSTEEKAATDE